MEQYSLGADRSRRNTNSDMKILLKTIMHQGLLYPAVMFNCPGCEEFGFSGLHVIPVNIHKDFLFLPRYTDDDIWDFNGNLHFPSLKPSIITRFEEDQMCNKYLINGSIHFLSDCTHSYRNEIIPLDHISEEYLK